jgi:hypothetical protein
MPLIDHKMGGFKEGLKLFGKPKNQVISRVSGHTALRSTVSKPPAELPSSPSANRKRTTDVPFGASVFYRRAANFNQRREAARRALRPPRSSVQQALIKKINGQLLRAVHFLWLFHTMLSGLFLSFGFVK